MPLWEGLDALYSLHAGVLTPCVGPLTPHLLSPLMWLYWLWHTEHGDDDQTIKSTPKGRAIRVTNHSTLFVCSDMCVCVCMCTKLCVLLNVTIRSNSEQVRRVKWYSPHLPPPAYEYETELLVSWSKPMPPKSTDVTATAKIVPHFGEIIWWAQEIKRIVWSGTAIVNW